MPSCVQEPTVGRRPVVGNGAQRICHAAPGDNVLPSRHAGPVRQTTPGGGRGRPLRVHAALPRVCRDATGAPGGPGAPVLTCGVG
ncbi:hypothetical protein [Ornithinimicrobium kibberense]|uniref:hypothetical protein n=1 Tax=Ornithinimicrobium kibberense TaxID=282060 RepID=UPI00361F881D